MITVPLVMCIIGLIAYIVSSDKTRRQLTEDIGRIVFAAAFLALMFALAAKVIYG